MPVGCYFFPCVGNIHFDTFHGMVFIFGRSIGQMNVQKFDAAIFDISLFVEFMRLSVHKICQYWYI